MKGEKLIGDMKQFCAKIMVWKLPIIKGNNVFSIWMIYY